MTRSDEHPIVARWVDQVCDADSGVSPFGRHLALELACYMDSDGVCSPSQERLCAAMARSERHVRRGIRELQREGFLAVFRSTRLNRYEARGVVVWEPAP